MTKQPTVLVTGGAGYVGSHVCKALHRAGVTPVTLDNLSTGHQQAVKWGPLEVGDVRDGDFVTEVMIRHKATAVLHFAALSLVGESAGKPYEYYANNVNGVLSLVGAMRRCNPHPLERLIHHSHRVVAQQGFPACLTCSTADPAGRPTRATTS